MGLNETVSAERLHIAFFGMRNAGKSSLVNKITAQQISVVSDVAGTTTDPVKKAMELLPLGPVVIIDTPGIDDVGELGALRVKRAHETLTHTDIAVLVRDCTRPTYEDDFLITMFRERSIPFIVAYNKCDLPHEQKMPTKNEVYISSKTGEGIEKLKTMLGEFSAVKENPRYIIRDLLSPTDTVILVMPIDESAPKGRIILPQQQTLREILDCGCSAICCQPSELSGVLNNLKAPPKMVVCDSQAFGEVSRIVPESITLTSFSILFARYKGDLKELVKGASKLKTLTESDTVLISEGCTHHRQCNDIGTKKIPSWIEGFCGHTPSFQFTSGGEFPNELSEYSLIVHCGGCMLNEREMNSRIEKATAQNIPIVNYGVAIAHMHGILKRSLSPFPEIQALL